MSKQGWRPPPSSWALVALGGAIGASLRHITENLLPWDGQSWPWAIFLVNIVGSFVMGGFLGRLSLLPNAPPYLTPLVGVGFLGGLTTFSSFAAELDQLAQSDALLLAAGYTTASVALGILAVRLGWILAQGKSDR
ncbi:MAG: fluoride efflux transporter CrcB [Micrococcales bacterium]|nr:fluoride efflux transporter CrcB [Micrococcales bacterium]